jgi:cysteine desulfurase/selenocysteine lyase
VIEAESTYYTTYNSNFGRGVYPLSMRSSELYEPARRNVQAFLNAEHPREIVFTKNTTDAINLVAASYGRAGLASGDEILITGMEHHSNRWRRSHQENGPQSIPLRVCDFSNPRPPVE